MVLISAVATLATAFAMIPSADAASLSIGAEPPSVSDNPAYEPNKSDCQQSLQEMVNNAAAGSVVIAPGGCVYRETVEILKPLTLRAEPGAEIRGSEKWTGWQQSGAYWVSKSSVPTFDPGAARCKADMEPRCLWPEQVFMDGEPLEQVASGPESGQFAVNSSKRVVLSGDPAGHEVEVTMRQRWIVGRAKNVTIEGFTMRHAASSVLHDMHAFDNNEYSGWTVRDNVLSDAHATVVGLRGENLKLIGNDISRGGQRGFGGGQGDILIQGNRIHHNNTENYRVGWEAGGLKVARVTSLVAEGNEVYENNGPGFWCDGGCHNATFSNNKIHHNSSMGILFETGLSAEIFGNTIWENGWGYPEWGWGAGIASSSSKNVRIYENTLAWNADGISVVSADRGGTDHDFVTNVKVHDNTILATDRPETKHNFAVLWGQDWEGGTLFDATSGNEGHDNRYYYPSPDGNYARFQWDRQPMSRLEEYNATPAEERGRYMSAAEKDDVVSSTAVPESPERETDVTAPEAPEITSPASDGYKNVRSFTVSGTAEPGSNVKLFDDNLSVKSVTADAGGNWSGSLSNVDDGRHVYTAKATDAIGFISPASASRTVIVDSQVPNTTINSGPDGPDNGVSPSFGFSSSEAGTTFECVLDSESFIACASQKQYTNLAEGAHTFKVRAIDAAGNVDPTPALREWTIDLKSPAVPQITSPSQGSYKASSFTVSGKAEPGSNVELLESSTVVGTAKTRSDGGWSVALAGVQGGPHSYTARVTDAAGNISVESETRIVNVDLTAPQANSPNESLVPGSTLGLASAAANVPVKLAWSGSDSGSGIARYEIQRSVNGGAYSPVKLSSAKATALTVSLEPGKSYHFRVRAVDQVGNTGNWVEGRRFTLETYQETNAAVTYAGGNWTSAALSNAYGGTTKQTSTAGASAKFTCTGREVAWVSWKGSDRGKADVLLDKTKLSTTGLYASTAQPRRVVFHKSGLDPSQQHTIEVRVAGTKRVDVDAFVVLR